MAKPVEPLVQVPPPVVLDKVVVELTHTEAVPVIAATVGKAFTVTVLSDVAAPQEFGSLEVNLRVTVPKKLAAGV